MNAIEMTNRHHTEPLIAYMSAPNMLSSDQKLGRRKPLIQTMGFESYIKKPDEAKRVKADPVEDNRQKLDKIAENLWLIKQQKKILKQRYDDLRKQVMELMKPGDVTRTKHGKLKYNAPQVKHYFNKETASFNRFS